MADDFKLEAEVQRCSWCREPPRIGLDGKQKPLKSCSRCKSAWYHDSACQRRHYPTHKKTCRKSVSTTQTNSLSKQPPLLFPKFKIEQRSGKGNILVSAISVRKGERICREDDRRMDWPPLVPPVLHEEYRRTRCAYCFQNLSETFYRFHDVPPKPQYLLLFCSPSCRDDGRKAGFQQEELSISRVYDKNGPPKIFSTAILSYRIFAAQQTEDSESFTQNIDKLQATPAMQVDSTNQYHTQAVSLTVVAMIQMSKDSMNVPPIENINEMVNRIKLNGFSICDGEFKALGVGIYDIPSFINHSCSPNAIQTFLFGQNKPAKLMLTAYEDIETGQEINISYIDNACPRDIRQKRLREDYFFWCDCETCNDLQHDAKIVALKCSKCESKETVERVLEAGPDLVRYKCRYCGRMDFCEQLRILQGLETTVSSTSLLKDQQNRHKLLTDICHVNSWYVQESGEQLLQSYLDLLSTKGVDIEAQMKVAIEALNLIEELVKSPQQGSSSARFKAVIMACKAAKLRLFIEEDPRRAFEEIESCEMFLKPFYPPNHEFMIYLDNVKHGRL